MKATVLKVEALSQHFLRLVIGSDHLSACSQDSDCKFKPSNDYIEETKKILDKNIPKTKDYEKNKIKPTL